MSRDWSNRRRLYQTIGWASGLVVTLVPHVTWAAPGLGGNQLQPSRLEASKLRAPNDEAAPSWPELEPSASDPAPAPPSEDSKNPPTRSPTSVDPKWTDPSPSKPPPEPTEAQGQPSPPLADPPAGQFGRPRPLKRPLPAWLRAHAPVRNMVEFGAYIGMMFPSRNHGLYGRNAGFRSLEPVSGALGGRIGFYPLSWFGAEVEAGGYLARTDEGSWLGLHTARGQVLFQLPWRLAPFVLGGVGALGVSSPDDALGDDLDPAWHLGLGLKFYICNLVLIRLEGRDILSNRVGSGGGPAHHPEVLFGVAFTFGNGPSPNKAKAKGVSATSNDDDHDGVANLSDKCPQHAGSAPNGCPPDRDGDGIFDTRDRCPASAGPPPSGCPADDDKDGIAGPADRCPTVAGHAPDGCPARTDADTDGVLDAQDRCPDVPENRNGYEDDDGCPEDLPSELAQLLGIVEGIQFERDSDRLIRSSFGVLNAASEVLIQYPTVRIEIVGHTDARGDEEDNRDLSQRRADAIRSYFIDHGVAADRLTIRGAGEDEPIASNKSSQGRAKNRRTEFHIVTAQGSGTDGP